MEIKYTIIGAGVVGLAIAWKICENLSTGENLVIVEKEDSFGRGISSRNSEVIHSGIYYPNGSLKHRLCLKGRKMLYEYCESRDVSYNKCGKLIIAADESEIGELERIYDQSQVNGVENVTMLEAGAALKLEPDITVARTLYSRETGFVDSHGLMKSLANDIIRNNGMIVYRSGVSSISARGNEYELVLGDGTCFRSDYVINAAGLGAAPGVHATIDLNGRLRFGPDVEYISSVDDFSIDSAKKDVFYTAACKLLKNLDYGKFEPDSAGIRPKIQEPHDAGVNDFCIRDESDRGYPGFINLPGIESPGLTSSLAIGEYVFSMIG